MRNFASQSVVSDINTLIISYPKSGRTWLRMLIGAYLRNVADIPLHQILDTTYLCEACNIPKFDFDHDSSQMPLGNTYHSVSFEKSKYSGQKIIFLTRNLKDTVVSAYFHATKRDKVFSGSLSEFVRDDRFGVRKILEFYNSWLANDAVSHRLHIISYENMHTETAAVLHKVLRLLGVENIVDEYIRDAVEVSKFDNMRLLEKQKIFSGVMLQAIDSNDPDSYKVRLGKVGGYMNYLTKADDDYIDYMFENYARYQLSPV